MEPARALSAASLGRLPGVATPAYDRSAVRVGVVHFGVGNFHRAHQAMYLDRLMATGAGLDWGVCGVGVLPQDARMRDVMAAQDCLFTLLIRHADGSLEPRVVGSLVEFLLGPDDPAAVFERLLDPAVRIVTLTVTEGGYLVDPASHRFDPRHPAVLHDAGDPRHPLTAFGYLVEGLRRRRAAGHPPFTVLSCDNLQGNGSLARQAVVGLARLVDAELAQWIEDVVAFPSCMVDRITPVTTDADRSAVRDRFGIEDRWPVPCEPFHQWVVEDLFPAGRPALETVGVQFVDDVAPYELMKLRLLNGGHQALAYPGALLGYSYVDEAVTDARVRRFVEDYLAREAAPTLGELPGIDLAAYRATLLERFGNPAMRDTLVRLATDGSQRMPGFVLAAARANLDAGRPVRQAAGLVALWAAYWHALARGDAPPDRTPDDVLAPELAAAALAQDRDPLAFLRVLGVFGDLGARPAFVSAYLRARTLLADRGVPGLLDALHDED